MKNGFKKSIKWTALFVCPIIAFSLAIIGASEREESGASYEETSQNISADITPAGRIYNILVLGNDEVSGLSDVLLIVSCDTNKKQINVLQIPRDTYAEYTDAAYRKINGARNSLGSVKAVADFLGETLSVSIDRYVTLDLDTVGRVVDVLGGVEIDVPIDMVYEDPYQGLSINIRKGKQILSGEEAKQFVRYRSGYTRGDLDRLDAQKLFLSSLVKKLSDQSNIFSVLEILGTVIKSAETDISYEYCFEIIKELGIPSMEDVTFVTLPGCDIQSSSGAWYYVMNRRASYELIKERFAPDITEDEFDKKRRFTSSAGKGFCDIYEATEGYETKIYSAREMSGG